MIKHKLSSWVTQMPSLLLTLYPAWKVYTARNDFLAGVLVMYMQQNLFEFILLFTIKENKIWHFQLNCINNFWAIISDIVCFCLTLFNFNFSTEGIWSHIISVSNERRRMVALVHSYEVQVHFPVTALYFRPVVLSGDL